MYTGNLFSFVFFFFSFFSFFFVIQILQERCISKFRRNTRNGKRNTDQYDSDAMNCYA